MAGERDYVPLDDGSLHGAVGGDQRRHGVAVRVWRWAVRRLPRRRLFQWKFSAGPSVHRYWTVRWYVKVLFAPNVFVPRTTMVCSPGSSGLNMMKNPSMIAGCGEPVMHASTACMLGSPWTVKRSSEMNR